MIDETSTLADAFVSMGLILLFFGTFWSGVLLLIVGMSSASMLFVVGGLLLSLVPSIMVVMFL